jgi:hypothetical protein
LIKFNFWCNYQPRQWFYINHQSWLSFIWPAHLVLCIPGICYIIECSGYHWTLIGLLLTAFSVPSSRLTLHWGLLGCSGFHFQSFSCIRIDSLVKNICKIVMNVSEIQYAFVWLLLFVWLNITDCVDAFGILLNW